MIYFGSENGLIFGLLSSATAGIAFALLLALCSWPRTNSRLDRGRRNGQHPTIGEHPPQAPCSPASPNKLKPATSSRRACFLCATARCRVYCQRAVGRV